MAHTQLSEKIFVLIELAEGAYRAGQSSQAVEALEVARSLALAGIAGQLVLLNEKLAPLVRGLCETDAAVAAAGVARPREGQSQKATTRGQKRAARDNRAGVAGPDSGPGDRRAGSRLSPGEPEAGE